LTAKAKPKKAAKCCKHCQDYVKCDKRGVCCPYCDFYLRRACIYGRKNVNNSIDPNFEITNYRGDDYGIDDYEAYEASE